MSVYRSAAFAALVALAAACGKPAAPPPPPAPPAAPAPAPAAPAVAPPAAATPTAAAPSFPTGFDFAALKARVDWRAHVLATGELDAAGKASVERGRALFVRTFTPQTGLGPFHNNTSCLACHNQPEPLGHGVADEITHFWAGVYPGNDADESKNPRLMPRYTAEGHAPFPMPPHFALSGERMPPQLLGLGWLEAIPGEQIRAQPHVAKAEPGKYLEPQGWVPEKREAARGTLRFGLKPGVATVDEFIIGALHAELGITTPNRAFDKDDDAVPDPEMTFDSVVDLANFVALSPPPARALPPEHAAGLQTFQTIGCAKCHWSAFTVEGKPTPQLYTDLLTHDLGPALADKQQMENTPAAYSRTTPLWAMHLNAGPYLHDGRAATVEAAILAHGGEATHARDAFAALDAAAKRALLATVGAL